MMESHSSLFDWWDQSMLGKPFWEFVMTDPYVDLGHIYDSIDSLRLAFDGSDPSEHMPPVHPGEILREEFMSDLGITAGILARNLSLPRSRIERIVKEEIGISPDTALRLSRYFGNSAQFWLNLQNNYEIEAIQAEIREELQRIVPAVWPTSHDAAR